MDEKFSEKQKTLFSRKEELKRKATPSEIAFKKRLDEAGIKYIFQKAFIQGNAYYFADFYLPKPKRMVIEIDGGYHDTDKQKYKDRIRDKYFTEARGFKVIRIKNEDVNSFDLSKI